MSWLKQAFYLNCVHDWYCSGDYIQPDDPAYNDTCSTTTTTFPMSVVDNCTATDDCMCDEPWSFVSPTALPYFWMAINYASLLLTWCIFVGIRMCMLVYSIGVCYVGYCFRCCSHT